MSEILVVKLGGTTIAEQAQVLAEVAGVARRRPVVLVHGGGRRISEWLERLGVPSRFEGGLRVTDAQSLEVAAAVLRGVVNSELVAGLRDLGVDAVGLSGVDGGLLIAERVPGMGLVAHVVGVRRDLVDAILVGGQVPVVAPSPSAACWRARSRATASTAAASLAAAGESARTGAAGEAPDARRNTVSFVLVSPSTLSWFHVRAAAGRRMSRRTDGSTTASVRTIDSMVAIRGWIIPTPFAMPVTRTATGPPSTSGSETPAEATFGRESVVRMASAVAASASSVAGALYSLLAKLKPCRTPG